MEMKLRYPTYLVEWDDAMADASWEIMREEDIKDSKCYTIGFLIGETEKHIVIASTYDEETEHTNARLQIPKGMITKQIKVDLPEEEVEKKHNLLLREE